MIAPVPALRLPTLRVVYFLTCAMVSAYALSAFAKIVQALLAVQYGFISELFIVLGQVGFQYLFMKGSSWEMKVRYAEVALTVSLIGSLLLLPLVVYHQINSVDPFFAVFYFFVVVGVIFVIHVTSILWLGMPKVLALTWVLYRVLILGYVLYPRNSVLTEFGG